MTNHEIGEGTDKILSSIPKFDYPQLLALVRNDAQMIELYNKTESNYEKLHLYRILFDKEDAGVESDVVKKFINEAFHIENDYIYQLNPREFQTVPHFVIEQCNQYVSALAQR